eukprot:15524294-Heterocapsa_arctica.AAC.1
MLLVVRRNFTVSTVFTWRNPDGIQSFPHAASRTWKRRRERLAPRDWTMAQRAEALADGRAVALDDRHTGFRW